MTGHRKLVFGSLAFVLTWCFAMWAPGVTEAARLSALQLMGVEVGIVVGGIAAENYLATKAGPGRQIERVQ